MSLLDLDCDASLELIELVSACSDEMAYNRSPMGGAGPGASQQGGPADPWRQGPDYGRHTFYAAPEMGPPAYPAGPAFFPPAPAAPTPLPPTRQPIAQIQSFSQQPFIPERQLEKSYSYAIDRGDGTFTRLIPADRLPPMYGLAQAQDREGLIVLPRPRAMSPHSRHAGLADSRFIARPTPIGERRPTQSSMQDIVMAQSAIDQIVASHPPNLSTSLSIQVSNPSQRPKRDKIYCDKWLHDGTCAFTQQGCKYLHEMPLDKEVQMSVGLFNGLPAWFKRQNSLELKRASNRRGSSTHGAGPAWRGRVLPIPVAPRGLLTAPPNPLSQPRNAPSANQYNVLFRTESEASEGDKWTRK